MGLLYISEKEIPSQYLVANEQTIKYLEIFYLKQIAQAGNRYELWRQINNKSQLRNKEETRWYRNNNVIA